MTVGDQSLEEPNPVLPLGPIVLYSLIWHPQQLYWTKLLCVMGMGCFVRISKRRGATEVLRKSGLMFVCLFSIERPLEWGLWQLSWDPKGEKKLPSRWRTFQAEGPVVSGDGKALACVGTWALLGGDGEVAKGQLQRSFGTWLRSLGFILKACSKPY